MGVNRWGIDVIEEATNMKFKNWTLTPCNPNAAAELESAGIPPLSALVLAARGFDQGAQAKEFLSCAVSRLHDPMTMKGMPEAVERLGLYCRRLLEKNQVMNLTAITDPADVMTLHFLDSAALLPTRALGGRKLIDVGTGAGFPGLVLRILDPTIRLTLLDSLGKRVEWLTELCRELDLPDVVLLKGRAEELSRRKTHREQYDVAVSRALAAMPMLAELCLPYVKPGGLFLAMKSNKTDEEIAGAEKIIQALGGEKPFVMDYLVPGTEVYHRVVTVFKARPTPGSYPRKWTKIKETKV